MAAMSSWWVVYTLQSGMVTVGMLALYFSLTTPILTCVFALVLLYLLYCHLRKRAAGRLSLKDRIVLITGCDSGFGHSLAKALFGHGCCVIATVYRAEGEGAQTLREVRSQRMIVIPLDVSCDVSVAQCLRHVKDVCKHSGLWGLVNNAGHNFVGDVELTTMSQYLMVSNVNIFGIVRTTKAFLPLLRRARGRIVNVTSVKGQVSTPLNAAYSITKFAAETFSEITRMEVKRFGVKVVIVEPGNFGGATGCTNKDGIARIRRELQQMWEEASDDTKKAFTRRHLDDILGATHEEASYTHPTLTPVTDVITEALCSGDPDFRYIVGGSNCLVDSGCMLARLKPFLSDRCFDQVVSYCRPYTVGNGDTDH